jgi:hypothetical protein
LNDEWLQAEAYFCLSHETSPDMPFVIPVRIDDCKPPPLLQPRAVNFHDTDFDEALNRLTSVLPKFNRLFVVMPLRDERVKNLYNLVFTRIADDFGYDLVRVDKIHTSGIISTEILESIKRSALVIADLTGNRPNCYYEAGFADALGKDLVLTTHVESTPEFDLAGRRFIKWSDEGDLLKQLSEWLNASKITRSVSKRID